MAKLPDTLIKAAPDPSTLLQESNTVKMEGQEGPVTVRADVALHITRHAEEC